MSSPEVPIIISPTEASTWPLGISSLESFFTVMESRFKMEYFYKNIPKKNAGKLHYLIDQKGYRFIVDRDYNDNLIFLNSRKICNFFDLPGFYQNGINDLYIDTRTFYTKQIKEIISYYKAAIGKLAKGQVVEFNKIAKRASKISLFSDYTKGHFLREVI